MLSRLPRPLQTVSTLLALSVLGPGAPAHAQPAAARRSPAPIPIQPEARHPLRCEPTTIEPVLVALCEALAAAPVLSDTVAVRIERPDRPPPAHAATDPARRSDLLRLGRSGDDLRLELRRPRHRRTLVTQLPQVLGAEAGARAEALRLTLAFLLEAPPDAGEPWPEGGDERSPLPPRVTPEPQPPAIGALPAPPPERLRDLEGPSPFPLRPPLVVPGPAPTPRPGPAAVEALPEEPPGADLDSARASAAATAARADPSQAARFWLGPAVLAGAEVEGGFSLGVAHPISGPWHGRVASTVAPFGEAGGGPLTGFATSLALEYLLSADVIRGRLHAGFAHRATLPQWAQAQVEGRHRIAGAIGTTLETSIGGPLALALEFEASLATGETRARGVNGERVEGPLTGRSALLLVWTL